MRLISLNNLHLLGGILHAVAGRRQVGNLPYRERLETLISLMKLISLKNL